MVTAVVTHANYFLVQCVHQNKTGLSADRGHSRIEPLVHALLKWTEHHLGSSSVIKTEKRWEKKRRRRETRSCVHGSTLLVLWADCEPNTPCYVEARDFFSSEHAYIYTEPSQAEAAHRGCGARGGLPRKLFSVRKGRLLDWLRASPV